MADNAFAGTTIKVKVPCNLMSQFEDYANGKSNITTEANIAFQRELMIDDIQIYPEAAREAGCDVNVIKPTTCDGKWQIVAQTMSDEYQFISWQQQGSTYCSNTLELTIDEVDDTYFTAPIARFAKESDFEIKMNVKTNAEKLGNVKTYNYSCQEDDIERANNLFFYGEQGLFKALEYKKGWVDFDHWDFDEEYFQYGTVMQNSNELKIEFRKDETENEDLFPTEITAIYTFRSADVTVKVNTEGDGKVLGAPTTAVKLGSQITLVAQPNADMYFEGWKLGGIFASQDNIISKEPTLSINLQPAHIYAVNNGTQKWIYDDGELIDYEDAKALGTFEAEYVAVFSNTPAGIEAVEDGAAKAVKIIENGQVLILRDGKRYNLLGAEVK